MNSAINQFPSQGGILNVFHVNIGGLNPVILLEVETDRRYWPIAQSWTLGGIEMGGTDRALAGTGRSRGPRWRIVVVG